MDTISRSDDIEEMTGYIETLFFRIRVLTIKKNTAMGIGEFYNIAKQIRIEKDILKIALEKYIGLERKMGFPVKLSYRDIYKKLTR